MSDKPATGGYTSLVYNISLILIAFYFRFQRLRSSIIDVLMGGLALFFGYVSLRTVLDRLRGKNGDEEKSESNSSMDKEATKILSPTDSLNTLVFSTPVKQDLIPTSHLPENTRKVYQIEEIRDIKLKMKFPKDDNSPMPIFSIEKAPEVADRAEWSPLVSTPRGGWGEKPSSSSSSRSSDAYARSPRSPRCRMTDEEEASHMKNLREQSQDYYTGDMSSLPQGIRYGKIHFVGVHNGRIRPQELIAGVKELFYHVRDCADGVIPKLGDRVSFIVSMNQQRLCARNVTLLDPGALQSPDFVRRAMVQKHDLPDLDTMDGDDD